MRGLLTSEPKSLPTFAVLRYWSTLLKKYLRDYAYLLGVAGFIIILDQVTKYLVRTDLPIGEYWTPWPWLLPYARIIHVSNAGAAFGLFQGFGDIFTILAIIVSLVILYYFPRVPREDWALRLAMGLQLGGAIGNLIDRVTQGSVTDFISVGNFAVFNVADASISIGVAILIIGMWIKEREQESSPDNTDEDDRSNTTDPTVHSLPEEVKSE
jgi:signal peptidase II